MDTRTKSAIHTIGGITEDSKTLPDPIGLEWNHRTPHKHGQMVSAIVYIPNKPENIIKAAHEKPEEIMNGTFPMGLIKVLGTFQDIQEAKDYGRELLNEGMFRELSTPNTGEWLTVVTKSKVNSSNKELIDANGRDILYVEKARIRNKESNYRKEAAKKMAILNQYDKDIENPHHIMKYVHLKHKKNYVGNVFLDAKAKFLEAAPILQKTIDEIQSLEEKHPEFKDNWKAALKKFCDDTGEDNPFSDDLEKVIDDTNKEAIGRQIENMNKMISSLE